MLSFVCRRRVKVVRSLRYHFIISHEQRFYVALNYMRRAMTNIELKFAVIFFLKLKITVSSE